MIYTDKFISFLQETFGFDRVKIRNKDIIIPCPYCELNLKKSHYHCYIKKDEPIFHCFFCDESGTTFRIIKELTGRKFVDDLIDRSKLKEWKKVDYSSIKKRKPKERELYIPPLGDFRYKRIYVQGRLGYLIQPEEIDGLVFDIAKFVKENNIILDKPFLLPYLQSNFVGFVTEHKSKLILRNIDSSSKFKFYKIQIYDTPFLDYYKIPGGNLKSKTIVLGEGVFDILSEKTLDSLGIRDQVRLYASGLSKSYMALLESVCFDEQLFRVDLRVISDSNVLEYEYKRWFKKLDHLIERSEIYYNLGGKDFNTYPVLPKKVNSCFNLSM